MKAKLAVCLVALVLGGLANAQLANVQINRENKTISVVAEETVTADAEVAVVELGVHNEAVSKDMAFRENVQVAERVLKAILEAGVPKDRIETENLSLNRLEPDEDEPKQKRQEAKFYASQRWKIRVPASQAQTLVDVAVRAGANVVFDAAWEVQDPIALQAKAGAAALAKARNIAEQMANGLGVKLGELVYASNRAPSFAGHFIEVASTMASVAPQRVPKPHLTLFPRKVKSEATVYAVFAIQ